MLVRLKVLHDAPAFTSRADRTVQRYLESYAQLGRSMSEYESLQEWREKGPFHHKYWHKSSSDITTRVDVGVQFATSPTTGQILLFDHYKPTTTVEVRDGVAVRVESSDY